VIWSRRRSILMALLTLTLVAPAAVFFFSAVGRSMQPVAHEPARTLSAIVTWFGGLPEVVILIVLVGLPLTGLGLAAGVLWRTWTSDEVTRADLAALAGAVARVARRPAIVVNVLVVVFGVLYFAAVTVHAVAG
jgi:hypothetical protein